MTDKITIAKEETFRSEERNVSQSDDMVRVSLDMKRIEWRNFKKTVEEYNTMNSKTPKFEACRHAGCPNHSPAHISGCMWLDYREIEAGGCYAYGKIVKSAELRM